MGAVHAAGQKEPCGQAAQVKGRTVVVIVQFCPGLTRQLICGHKARTHGEDCAISLRDQLTHLALRADALDIDTAQRLTFWVAPRSVNRGTHIDRDAPGIRLSQ